MTTTKKLIVLLAAALGGCGADVSGIVIRGRAASTTEPAEGCAFDPGGELQLGPGLLDVGAGRLVRYRLPLYLTNSLRVPPVGPGEPESFQKTWFAHATRVTVRPGGASATITHAPVAVLAGGGESADVFEVVDAQLAPAVQQLAPAPGELRRVVLDITLDGETQDGEGLETNVFSYPIDLCVDCIPTPVCAPGETLTRTACGFEGQDSPSICVAGEAPAP
jgi:hypothetical protein